MPRTAAVLSAGEQEALATVSGGPSDTSAGAGDATSSAQGGGMKGGVRRASAWTMEWDDVVQQRLRVHGTSVRSAHCRRQCSCVV